MREDIDCRFCQNHEEGDTLYESSDWDGGIGFDYIWDIKFCPLCGRKLRGEEDEEPVEPVDPPEDPEEPEEPEEPDDPSQSAGILPEDASLLVQFKEYKRLNGETIICLERNNQAYDTTEYEKALANVTEIRVPGNFGGHNVVKIMEHCFADFDNLETVVLPDGIEVIGESAFYDCRRLTSITIPDSVTTIDRSAFDCCVRLTSITIPDSVTTIGGYAFSSCSSLKEVYCEATTPPTASLYKGNWDAFSTNHADRLIYVPMESVDDYKAADEWKEYKDYIVGYQPNNHIYYESMEKVTPQPSNDWAGGIEITSHTWDSATGKGIIIFSGDVTSIPGNTFISESGMSSISLPASLKTINATVFKGCTGLTEITIPANVTKVGNNAFTGCTMLANVYCKPTTPPTLGTTPFENNASGRKIYVPATDDDSVLNAYKEAWSAYAADIAEE